MRHHRQLALAVTLLLVAGCTSTNGHGTSATSSSGSTPTVTSAPSSTINLSSSAVPTPTSSISATSSAKAWTIAVAKQHATQIVADVTSAVTTLSHAPENSSLSQAQAALRALATADQTALQRLASGAWPGAVRDKVNAYIAALDTERRTLLELAGKNSLAAIQAGGTQVSPELTEVQTAGQALTTALT